MRWKYFIPIVVIITGLTLFYTLIMNKLIERGLEKAGESIFKARTEISGFRFNLFGGEIKMERMAVADADDPWYNLFEIGKARFDVSVKALLLKRLVISDARIEDISWHTKRKTYGGLPEVEEEKKKPAKEKRTIEEKKKPGMLEEIAETIDIDGIIEKYKSRFRTPKIAEEAKNIATNLDKKWNTKIKETDKKIKIASTKVNEIKKINVNKIKSPAQVALYLKKVQDAYKTVNETITYTKNVYNEFQQDRTKVLKTIDEIRKAKDEDWKFIISLVNIPAKAKFKSFTQDILSKILYKKLGKVYGYIRKGIVILQRLKEQDRAKKKPPKRKKKRFKGRDVIFPSMGYPKFLLTRALISVKKETMYLKGEIKNLRSSPEKSREPTTFYLGGNLDEVRKLALNGIFDYRRPGEATHKLIFKALNFPLHKIGETIPYIKLNDFKARYDFIFNFLSKENETKRKGIFTLTLKDIKMKGDTKDIVTRLVMESIQEAKKIVIEGDLSFNGGTTGKLKSNLDKVLTKKIKVYIQNKINKARARIKKSFDKYITKHEIEARKKLTDFTERYRKPVENKKKIVENYKKILDAKRRELEKKKKELEEKGKREAEKKAKKVIEKIKPKLPLGR